ncbi:MAG: tetratricopeptide repeat protein [Deferribacteraceae bacterium]|jgi:Flp pilus assembly protein TadD|nr:tetratricopeptide repeat protein [Deferribacteraceae bacterium]
MTGCRFALLALFVLFIFSACSGEKATVGDAFTDNTSVTSAVASREPLISEGNNAFLRGDFRQAVSYYEMGLRENRSVAYYNMGVSYYLMKDIRKAEENFRLAVAEDPNFDEAVMNLVATLAEQEKTVEAEQYMSRLVNKKKSARVYVDMANLSLKNGNSASALFYYQKALEIDDNSPYILSNYANFMVSMGELDEGERILNLLPNRDFNINYNLAYIAFSRRDPATAYFNAKSAMEFDGTEEGYNKLAALFASLKKYPDETSALRRAILWNPKKEYRLRLVKSYLRNWNLDMAADEANGLLNDYSQDIPVIVANYEVQVAMGNSVTAGNFIRKEYERDKGDRLLYQTVRHMCLFDGETEEARRLLSGAPDTPFANLARAAYHIRAGNLKSAESSLAKVPESTINDYYIYKSFLQFKDKSLREAELTALKIDESKPEYFWYHFVLAWDLRKPERIIELTNSYREDYIIASRVPILNFSLTPVKEDLSFNFKFDGLGTDMAGILLYPFFIEPDEIYPFLILGYRLLKDSEEAAALIQLQRSLIYSDAVRLNNEGAELLLIYDYKAALAKFNQAFDLLKNDPFLRYNMGVAHLMGGEFQKAEKEFAEAIRLNRYLVPAYVGQGYAVNRQGKSSVADGLFYQAKLTAEEYEALDNLTIILPMVTRAKYLAMLALSEMDEIVQQIDEENNRDNFMDTVAAAARFYLTSDMTELEIIRSNNAFHSDDLAYLLELRTTPLSAMTERVFADRSTVMAAKYITLDRKRLFDERLLELYMKESMILTELVNYAILSGDKDKGLRYLQLLNYNDYRYVLQYKASMYYFLWTRGFINVAASSNTLENARYYDKEVHYYRALFYLITNNRNRFADQANQYAARYPEDYRASLLVSLNHLQEREMGEFLSGINKLLSDEPYLFNKMPLGVDIERF